MFLKREAPQSANKFNSNKKDIRQQVPSFDNLQARIRDFSYSRLSNVVATQPQRNEPTYSPYKAQGLQQKITDTLGPRTKSFNSGNKWRESFQSPSISSQSPFKFVQSPPQIKYSIESESYTKPQSDSFKYDSFRTSSEYIKKKQGRNLADVVQLNEIVALRNKIESSYVSRNSLTSTYVSELVKLAQAITTSLKNE
ncbi:unnamed protein product [Paramecium sonneborni]|uniref:Uncharacterized protein n=1 Tax=Paramecium sonneborni TaxID=65129 RepID=A0A8S1R535_9CILI|nr:unnamed protein product [Paramecium sonneborni]